MPPKPQAPAAECLQACPPLVPDAGGTAADALRADARNRAQYLRCQLVVACLVPYVRNLMRHGVIEQEHPTSSGPRPGR